MATDSNNDYNLHEDNMDEKESSDIKAKIMAELRGELLLEMNSKNKALLDEISKLKNEIRDLNEQKDAASNKRRQSIFKKIKKKKKKKPQILPDMHSEWPKLEVKDRAALRKKLAKEIKQHHNMRKKKVFKLEKQLIKREKKLEKYKKEISKLERQLRKHGVKYVGPPEEDSLLRLIFCQQYKSFDLSTEHEDNEEYIRNYERRYSISHNAVKLEERQVQRKWAELFTDLIFVAIIVKFASQINSRYIYFCKAGDTENMILTLLNGLFFFMPFWCLWLELTVTLIRFHDFEGKWYGLVDDTLIFIILAGVIEISFQIDINADLFEVQYANRFLLGFGLCIVALLLLHIFYRWKLYPAKRYTTRRIYSYSLSLCLLFIALIDSKSPFFVIGAILSSCFVMLYVTLVSFRVHPNVQLHDKNLHVNPYHLYCLESIVERFGIFSMIVIGESILALLISPDPGSFIRYICVYFAFALLFLFQLMYFGSHAEEGCHALHKLKFPGSVAWIFMHLPLSTSLLFVGIGLRLLVTFADLDRVPPQISIVLVSGTTLTILNYHILRQCHDKFVFSVPSLLRLLPIVLCPTCLLMTSFDSFGIILWCFIIAISSWFFDIILINEYETKPIWMSNLLHQANHGHDSHGEFEFHPEEYNPLYLPYDSWLFCRNYDGEHGRTLVVTLAEYLVDPATLHHVHEIEASVESSHHHEVKPPQVPVKITKNEELHKNMPTSPTLYIQHQIERYSNLYSHKKEMSNLSVHHHQEHAPSVSFDNANGTVQTADSSNTPIPSSANHAIKVELYSKDKVQQNDTSQPPISPFNINSGGGMKQIKKSANGNANMLNIPFHGGDDNGSESDTDLFNKSSSLKSSTVDWDSWVQEFEEEHEVEHEHHHQWFSEFADLVFVAIIINFADQIKNIAINECVADDTSNYIELNCLTLLLIEASLFFLSFFMVWYELSVTIIRFTEIDGVFDDILKFLYLCGIVTMTLQMSKEEFLSSNISGFITGIIICLLCCTLLHIVYYFNVENCQLYCRKRIILYFSSIFILLIVSIIDHKLISMMTITVLSILILWISSNSFRVILTPNDEMLELPEDVFEHTVERWGIFVMIATGESILALIATTNKLDASTNKLEEDIAFQHYISILCAFGITYLVSHYYLESSKINSMHFHALMHAGSPGSVLWTLLHGLLAFFLMLVGAGWKLLLLSLSLEICWIDANEYYKIGKPDYVLEKKGKCCDKYHVLGECYEYDGNGWIEFSILLGVSLTLSLITMYLLRTSHPKFIFSWKSILCRAPIILFIPCGAYWTSSFQTQSFYYSVWCLILMTISYFVDHLFIDIYQTDIKPELRTFYNAQIAPSLRQQTLQLHLMESKRKSLEFTRSASLSKLNSHH